MKKQATNKMEVSLVRALLAASTNADSNPISLNDSGKVHTPCPWAIINDVTHPRVLLGPFID